MDMEEFHDFVIECDLPTKDYAYDTMVMHYQGANQGSGDKVLELVRLQPSFLTRILAMHVAALRWSSRSDRLLPRS